MFSASKLLVTKSNVAATDGEDLFAFTPKPKPEKDSFKKASDVKTESSAKTFSDVKVPASSEVG